MMERFLTSLLLAGLISLQGCNITSTSVIPEGKTIFGSWNWEKTITRSGAVPPITPGNAGYTKQFEFTRDSVLIVWQNNDKVFQGRFTITRELTFLTTPDSGDVLRIGHVSYPEGTEWVLHWIHKDTLELRGLCVDCADVVFSRMP